jgi:hypothetical protein
MDESRAVNNELSGHVDGPVVQAGFIRDVVFSSPRSTVNNIMKEARSLNVLATLYRCVASLASMATFAILGHGGSPLDRVAAACDAAAIPSGWVTSAESWVHGRSELVAGAALVMLSVGLLALPKRQQVGWDLGETLEWRSPSTVVLSFSLLVQCGYIWQALLTVGILGAFGAWVVSWEEHRRDRSDHVMVVVGSVFLAVVFAPLYVFVWLFGRDAVRRAYVPANAAD